MEEGCCVNNKEAQASTFKVAGIEIAYWGKSKEVINLGALFWLVEDTYLSESTFKLCFVASFVLSYSNFLFIFP